MFFPLSPTLLIVFSVLFAFQIVSPAQDLGDRAGKAASKIRSIQDIRALSGLTKTNSEKGINIVGMSYAVGDPCSTPKVIGYGQSFFGDLDPADCELPDGTLADLYLLEGAKGQQIEVEMRSGGVDSYLILVDESGEWFVEDDDGGGGANAKISAVLPHSGFYLILANSVFREFGSYQIFLDKAPRCTFTPSPESIDADAGGGTYSFDVATEPGCFWGVYASDPSHINLHATLPVGATGFYGPRTITYDIRHNNSGNEFRGSIIIGNSSTYAIRQPALVCTYTLDKQSLDFPGEATTQQIFLNTLPGCQWTGTNNGQSFIGLDKWNGTGPATLTAFTFTNSGATRTATLTIGGQNVAVTQQGLNCTYSLSATTFQVAANPAPGIISINTQQDCTWGIESDGMIQYNAQAGPGSREITYYFNRNYMAKPRSHTVRFFGGGVVTIPLTFHQAGAVSQPVTVSGRVITSDGRAIRAVKIDLVDEASGTVRATVTSSSLGYFSFQDVPSGYGYFLRTVSKRYRFNQLYHQVIDHLDNVVITGLE